MENNSCTKICRLCLELSSRNFETIEEALFANLDFLLLKLNLSISEKPVMCGNCAKTIKTCSDFKSKCLEIENCIVSSVKNKTDMKRDLQEVYIRKMSVENIFKLPEGMVCRLCLESANNYSAIFLKNSTDIVQKLELYFPEVVGSLSVNIAKKKHSLVKDLTCSEDPLICASCQVSLQHYCNFINKCVATEEKITEYCKVEGTNGMGQIDLNSIMHFSSKDFLKSKFDVGEVKVEGTCNRVSENTSSNVEIYKEEILAMELDIKEEISAQESELTDDSLQHHPSPSQSDFVPNVQILTHKGTVQEVKYNCEICPFTTKTEDCIKKHMVKHKNASELTMYSCVLCPCRTKRKHKLPVHVITHKDVTGMTVYKCDLCDYKSKWKSNKNRHLLTHKTDFTIFQCQTCAYKTKHEDCLQRHMLTHVDEPEIRMYECELCFFKTKGNTSFRNHLLSHRNTADVVTRSPVYKCDLCDYQVNQKCHMKKHMLTHQTDSEITMYKCNLCNYKTKRKSDLKRHMLTCRIHLEKTMFKCETCTFETKHKGYLQKHTLTHKDASDIEVHMCELCPTTRCNGSFQNHMVSHRNPQDIVTPGIIYKCGLCDFVSKWKISLKGHMLIHKTRSEITTFKCYNCDYESIRKSDLKKHMLTHSTHSELYKCEVCPFKTKTKSRLKKHLHYHRNAPDVCSTFKNSLREKAKIILNI